MINGNNPFPAVPFVPGLSPVEQEHINPFQGAQITSHTDQTQIHPLGLPDYSDVKELIPDTDTDTPLGTLQHV